MSIPDKRARRAGDIEPGDEIDRVRVLLTVALKPSCCAVVVGSVLIIATLLVSRSDPTGAYGAIAAAWLATHQVPLTIGHTTLGVLPLSATVAVMWLVARECFRAARLLTEVGSDLVRLPAAAVGMPLMITLIALAVIDHASGSMPLRPPHPPAVLGRVAAIHLGAAFAGLLAARGREWLTLLPSWASVAQTTIVPITASARRLFGAAAVLTVVSLLWHASRVGANMGTCDGIMGKVALALLSLVYLPNIVVGAGACLFGATMHIGAASVGLAGSVSAALPAVPVLGAVPSGSAGLWWLVLLVVPLYVTVVLGRECAMRCRGRVEAVASVAVAGVIMAALMTILVGLSGGELGAFGSIGVEDAPLFAVLVFGWIAVPGLLGAFFGRTGVIAPPVAPQVVRHALTTGPRTATDSNGPDSATVREPRVLPGVRYRDRPIDVEAELIDTPVLRAVGTSSEDILDAEIVDEHHDSEGGTDA